ncbi:uncharacterized protein LOC110094049 [Dendrobium catenatum]|uniref:uncharacterized protein LOC110094049 n=1 Tax=Dendrobium catenatum TaxID=906689 RepID=UPI0009F41EDF|nr:uncharacterized protein LOC110094049 [Dendrobium catenatum]
MRKLAVADFAKVMQAAQEKMNVWGKKQLSLAGRALLINTSLLSIPMYLMTHSVIPNGVLHFIERLGRQFLWQKDPNSRGMHYVGWQELCKPKNQGGLGFHDLLVWKGALRARVVWDMLRHPESFLYKILLAKYGMKLWDNNQGKNFSATWKIIQDGAYALWPILRWNIGNGIHIDVLQDVWILDRNVAKWPMFVNVEEVENTKVCDFLNTSLQWNEEMIKRCFGDIIAERILAIEVSNDTQVDSPELIHNRRDMTVAAMAYRANFGVEETNFCWLYNLKLHPRERFFWWRFVKDAVIVVLAKWGFVLPSVNSFPERLKISGRDCCCGAFSITEAVQMANTGAMVNAEAVQMANTEAVQVDGGANLMMACRMLQGAGRILWIGKKCYVRVKYLQPGRWGIVWLPQRF